MRLSARSVPPIMLVLAIIGGVCAWVFGQPTLDHFMRGTLAAQAFVCLFMTGHYIGGIWRGKPRPGKVLILGGGLLQLYVLFGQLKAFMLAIPYDAFSMLGTFAYAVITWGLIWSELRERSHRAGA